MICHFPSSYVLTFTIQSIRNVLIFVQAMKYIHKTLYLIGFFTYTSIV
ncbi:conserved domain protein [Paenibacillus sp. HGF5]|nr:conserved domain protein [Paenibacillus sp. HGF5]